MKIHECEIPALTPQIDTKVNILEKPLLPTRVRGKILTDVIRQGEGDI
jgi:hypothetical protein